MELARYAIIVAGGTGERMGGPTPKQFLLLNGMPILMHTLKAFHGLRPQPELILALPSSHFTQWKELCRDHAFDVAHTVVVGGNTRFHSVKNALTAIEGQGLVAIHDGVRPLVDSQLIERCFQQAAINDAVVPVVKPNESVRLGSIEGTVQTNRDEVWLVQTPQVFWVEAIKKGYDTQWQANFTDDASVAERSGMKIWMVEGDPENIKITRPIDLLLAETILKSR